MTAPDIISTTRISDVWRALGGGELRSGRGRAWWRKGEGWSVSIDDRRGVWYDHRDATGGGVLDLLMHVRGGTRADAIRTLADLAGVTLDDRPRDRKVVRETARIQCDSVHFAFGAREMAEEALEQLGPADPERAVHTALLRALAVSPEAEYRGWLEHQPEMARALVYAGRQHNRRVQRMLVASLMAMEEGLDAT